MSTRAVPRVDVFGEPDGTERELDLRTDLEVFQRETGADDRDDVASLCTVELDAFVDDVAVAAVA